jgi:hypothetical protein
MLRRSGEPRDGDFGGKHGPFDQRIGAVAMAISFRLEEEHGMLDWSYAGKGAVSLDREEAMIVAVAEGAAALRAIAEALSGLGENIDESGRRIADAIESDKISKP